MGIFFSLIGIVLLIVGVKLKPFKGISSVNELGQKDPYFVMKTGIKGYFKIVMIFGGVCFLLLGLTISCMW